MRWLLLLLLCSVMSCVLLPFGAQHVDAAVARCLVLVSLQFAVLRYVAATSPPL